MIRTASYFNPQDFVGKLISISGSEPPGAMIVGKLRMFAPPRNLVMALKHGHITWEQYEEIYKGQLDDLRQTIECAPENALAGIHMFVDVLSEDCTLLCWEHTPAHCHRRLVAEWLEREFGMTVEVR